MPGSSNYPFGFPQGVTIRNVPLQMTNPGQVFWVYNGTALGPGCVGGSDGNNGTFAKPFATLNYALSICSAGRGDIVMVKSGHAETVSAATGTAFATAGVAIVGLGQGTTRPKLTFDTANTATVAVSADNISIQNFQFVANFLSIAAPFTLSTAKWFTVQNCAVIDTSGVLNFLNVVKSTGAANTVDGLTVTDSAWNSKGTTSVNTFILTANTIDSLTASRNQLTYATTVDAAGLIVASAGVLTNLLADQNVMYRNNTTTANGSLINVGGTTSTGVVSNNKVQTLTNSGDALFTTTVGLAAFNNLVTGVKGASGFLIPAADT